MTEPEALDLLASIKRTTTIGEAIEAIQRAFEEQTRELRERLEDALLFVPDNYSFPRQDAPVTENSHEQ